MKVDTTGVSSVGAKVKEYALGQADLTGGFSVVISELRNKKGLKQEDLSKLVGLQRTSITNIESGRQKISVLMLLKIIDALGLEMQISFKDKAVANSDQIFGPAFGLATDRPSVLPAPDMKDET